jgi:hypothetical protein
MSEEKRMTFEELRKEMQKLRLEDRMELFKRQNELREKGDEALLVVEGYYPAE